VADMKKKALPAAKARTGTRSPAAPAKARKVSARKGGVAGKKVSSFKFQVGTRRRVKTAKDRHAVKAKEVTAAWKPEMPLCDGQQEGFCRLMALGAYSNYSCYAQAYPGSSMEAARSSSSDLLTKPNIRARIAWIREDSLKEVKIRIEESLRWYQTVRDTPVGYVDEESPLAQEVQKEIEGTEETGPILKVKIKIPSKMDAQRQIDKLMGFEKPQEINLNLPYEPPGKALERLTGKGVDLAAILKKAGVLGK